MKGKFISFEGSDGAGKTTALSRVFKLIRPTSGMAPLITREPGGDRIAEEIRHVILDPDNTAMDAKTEALLYAAARRQHVVQDIVPALKTGRTVLCDRYVDSSVAYQGGGRQLGFKPILKLNQYATGGLEPDLTIYFKIPAKVGLDRIQNHRQNKMDRLDQEKLGFHQRVNNAYDQLAKANSNRIKVINADQDVEHVVADVLRLLKNDAHLKFKENA
ncbi:dTMP kinase [Acetilactobacillus jinshanensis]|uniref:Thymidylate kinase n=1 Tax=Acetilactobacillus jinshanensis TaxID=1720083 RepID=A0A4P6ZMI3_9LACO|nr:dTMP kinase [Acetilactobacillus jinshanensis]QBP18833.1 dTMP kinase [Acetilactobacillus jinshanensis]URL61700.1 dTMP kinase [uncultured bacterium]